MKTPRSLRSSILAISLGMLGLVAAQASAQTVITSVPYEITASGHYTLGGNLNSSAVGTAAIRVNAPNVVLDLGGYYVAGPGSTGLGNSIQDSVIQVGNVANVTIRNGTVAGAPYGIFFSSTSATTSRNYVVEKVTVTRCYIEGIVLDSAAPGSVVRDCSFSTIGNSTNSANASAFAIFSHGGVRIERNNIGDVTATGTGYSYGIVSSGSDLIIGNTIANCKTGVYGGKYLNNLTYNVTTPFQNGISANGNN